MRHAQRERRVEVPGVEEEQSVHQAAGGVTGHLRARETHQLSAPTMIRLMTAPMRSMIPAYGASVGAG
jgi:hypothetical protein